VATVTLSIQTKSIGGSDMDWTNASAPNQSDQVPPIVGMTVNAVCAQGDWKAVATLDVVSDAGVSKSADEDSQVLSGITAQDCRDS